MHINFLEERSVSAAASAATGSHVLLRGVGKTYGARAVLHAVDLDIRPGQFVAVVGRSGCGKSTLLRTIAGLERADTGSVQAGEHLRLMFQEARLLPWKTVFDNVLLGQPGRIAQARAALDAVGLGARGHEWPAVLSGGQRQRVALARALVSEPALLLLDEPLGALDALTRMEMQQLIEALWRERGFTAVLVTHDVQEALALADRVLVIERGAIGLDLPITLPRPRRRGTPEFATVEGQLLAHLTCNAG